MVRRSLALLLVAGLFGCGPSGGSCPNDLPAGCPTAPPSYSQAAPVLHSKCGTCHSAGGTAPDRLFDTYDEIAQQKSATLDQTYSCKMPPVGSPQLSAGERQLVLSWLVCSPLPQ
jgi:uncharacterized membrane protein